MTNSKLVSANQKKNFYEINDILSRTDLS